MTPEKKVSIHLKGVFDCWEYGVYVDGESLRDVVYKALGAEAIEARPCDIWLNITLPEQGVDVR